MIVAMAKSLVGVEHDVGLLRELNGHILAFHKLLDVQNFIPISFMVLHEHLVFLEQEVLVKCVGDTGDELAVLNEFAREGLQTLL